MARSELRGQRILSRQSLLEAGIQQLQNDRTNGAQELATNAVKVLQKFVAQNELIIESPTPPLWTQIRLAGYRLSLSRPSMGSAITSALTEALAAIGHDWMQYLELQGSDLSDLSDLPDLLDSSESRGRRQIFRMLADCRLTDLLERREKSSQLLGQRFAQYLLGTFETTGQPLRILTLSSSSSLRRCFLQAFMQIKDLNIELSILESRPRCEGATFGTQLLDSLASEMQKCGVSGTDLKLKIIIAPDSHVCRLAQDVDIVLLGADRISAGGDVSNKMGSLAAVLCAKQLSPNVEIIVASKSEKIAKPGIMADHVVENNDEGEVISGWDETTRELYQSLKSEPLTVENTYFEWVPARYIDAYFTENGILDAAKIGAISSKRERLEREIFDEEIVALAQH
jgi:translation initiation factor 2B subunit (eIF-2B alpha/beta/delta family)